LAPVAPAAIENHSHIFVAAERMGERFVAVWPVA